MNIVSLLPSATEIVCALGATDDLVGVSHSCDYPRGIDTLPIVTATTVPKHASSAAIDQHVRTYLGDHAALYTLDLKRLAACQPDVIVSQRLCDVCAVSSDDVTTALNTLPSNPRLVDLAPEWLDDVYCDIKAVAEALGRIEQAATVVQDLKRRVAAVAARTSAIPVGQRPRVAMLEWLDPPFNSGHWNPELVEIAGGVDCTGPRGTPSQQVTWMAILAARPDVLVLGCCGFDRQRTREDLTTLVDQRGWTALRQQVRGRIFLTDGHAYFSRPGPRLIDGLEALAHALHPGVHPPPSTAARVEPA